jgi:uncharacterized membrane protein YhaH (DUF805 family)
MMKIPNIKGGVIMNFQEAVRVCLREKYADFSGRARASEYWWFQLFAVIACVVPYLLYAIAISLHSLSLIVLLALVQIVVSLGLIVPGLAVCVRRLHDVGKSGWFWFICLVPFVGGFILLYFLIVPGQPTSNAYGETPAV